MGSEYAKEAKSAPWTRLELQDSSESVEGQ